MGTRAALSGNWKRAVNSEWRVRARLSGGVECARRDGTVCVCMRAGRPSLRGARDERASERTNGRASERQQLLADSDRPRPHGDRRAPLSENYLRGGPHGLIDGAVRACARPYVTNRSPRTTRIIIVVAASPLSILFTFCSLENTRNDRTRCLHYGAECSEKRDNA